MLHFIYKLNKIAGSKKKHRSIKIGPLAIGLGAFVGIIIAVIVVAIVIIGVICFLLVLCLRHKTKKAQSTEQGKLSLLRTFDIHYFFNNELLIYFYFE